MVEGISPSLPERMLTALYHVLSSVLVIYFIAVIKYLTKKISFRKDWFIVAHTLRMQSVCHSEKGVVAEARVKQLLIWSLQLVGRER